MKVGGEQNLTVALRVRPLTEDEILRGCTPVAHTVDNNMVVLMDPSEDPDDVLRANRSRERKYVFDTVFDGHATQDTVYGATTKFLIENVVSGYNATVFAYGATGAGKTYTMLGREHEPGIMARALNDLFLEVEKTSSSMLYTVTMSYLEIYNEMIRDLLDPSAGILDLREDAKGGVQVAGLSEVSASSTKDVMEMLMKGNKERTQEPTAANKTSSRSHAVLQVVVKQRNRVHEAIQEVRIGKLFMIDLAGSERASSTLNRGKRMVEGAHINRSLLALGNCINALSDKNGPRYVNYRDSKLTRLLKDALGGNCKTVMIANISAASMHFEESRNTLVYAYRAKQIKTKVRRNVIDVTYHLTQYTSIISELRQEITRLRQRLQSEAISSKQPSHIQAIQSEVLGMRGDKNAALHSLKNELLTSFKGQMEFRRNLMELTNTSMEISLETSRNQLIITEWESERARKKQESVDNMDSRTIEDSEKELDMDSPDPEEVRVAREELKVLHEEKHRTETLRMAVQRELEMARHKVQSLEETLPKKIRSREEQEILSLLCKVHELEIEKMELQSDCFLRDFQIRKKDMMIARYRLHRQLCDEIILHQRSIIEEYQLSYPKELDELYELYKLEGMESDLSREASGASIALIKMSTPMKRLIDADKLHAGNHSNEGRSVILNRDGFQEVPEEDKLFSQSLRSKHIKQAMALEQRSDPSTRLAIDPDFSSNNLSPTPPSLRSVERLSPIDRNLVLTNTRGIHALATKKKTKAQLNLINTEKQAVTNRSLYRNSPTADNDDGSDFLSISRLAQHNKRFGELPVLMAPRQSSNESSMTPRRDQVRPLGVVGDGMPSVQGHPVRVSTRYRNGIKRHTPRETDSKRRVRGKLSNQTSKIPRHKRLAETSLSGRNGGSVLASDSSAVSTPQSHAPVGRHPPPLAPIKQYVKGDMAIMGFSLQRYP